MIRATLALMLVAGAAPAAPVPAAPVPAPVSIEGPPGTVCEVTLAHWYVLRVVPSPDGGLSVPFRFDPASETVSILNREGVEMAVEGLICGPEADLQTSGRRLDFRGLARAAQAGEARATCKGGEPQLDCGEP